MKIGDVDEIVAPLATEYSLDVYTVNVLRYPIRL